jgi:hypothetical protein
VTEQNEIPDDDSVDQETALPLPERDAMSVIGGPQPPLLPVEGDVVPTTDPEDPVIQPSPRYDI